jgi:hydroxyacylglutathione hydrolase
MTALYLRQLPLGPMQNFVYLIGDPATHEAAVVDPSWNVPAILTQAADDGYRLTHVLLTHGHYDHINGVEAVVEKTDATVCAYKSELEEFIAEGMGGLVIPRSSLKKTNVNTSVKVGNLEVRTIHTPGHTPGSQCLWIEGAGPTPVLVTGDTLFVGTIGRCDLPYSSPPDLFSSLGKIKKLNDEATFYPGHDYGASSHNTLKNEKRTNPFLMADSLERFFQMVRHG